MEQSRQNHYWDYDIDHNSSVTVSTGANATINNNVYQFVEYKALEAELNQAKQKLKEAENNLKKLPNDADFHKQLSDRQHEVDERQKNIDDFKQDVLILAERFNNIPINTERQKQAKQAFENGDFTKASAILDTEAISRDQRTLLDKQQRSIAQQTELKTQLGDNANEFILKALLVALDYSLPDRIEKTSQLFELALKSNRNPETYFEYAIFMKDSNKFQQAVALYREAIKYYLQLAKSNSNEYLEDAAGMLDGLGYVLSDVQQAEAENLHNQALNIYRQLNKDKLLKNVQPLISTLNSIGNLMAYSDSRQGEAETMLREALSLSESLPMDKRPLEVAFTQENLGNLIAKDSSDEWKLKLYIVKP